MIKKVLYMRSGPYKPDINMYNMQELGVAKALLKKGISTDVMYYSDISKVETYRETESAKIRIIWEKGYKILRTGFYPRLLKKSVLGAYDLIVLTEFSQIMTYLVSRRHNNTILYTGPYYNLFKLPFCEPIYDFLFTKSIDKSVRRIFTKSQLATDYMCAKGYHNVQTLGVGLDTEKFDLESDILAETRDLINLMKDEHCILYVGSLIDRKNFPFTLKVFDLLVNKYHMDYKLVIIGSGEEKYVNGCFNALSDNAFSNVIHIDRLPNAQLKYIYPLAEFFILPSKLEIFGMVMLEAMYFGSVVITSVNGGSSTLINDGVNGLVVNGFDSKEWAIRIVEAIRNNSVDSIRNEASRTIKEHFTWDTLVSKMIDTN